MVRLTFPILTVVAALQFPPMAFPKSFSEESSAHLKELLSNPPFIKQLVYSIRLPNAGRVAVSPKTPLAGSTNFEFYEVRWQPGAMCHRRLLLLTDMTNDVIRGECFSLWRGQFFFLDAQTRPSMVFLDPNQAARGIYSGAYHAAHIRITQASEPLNLGLCHLEPGSIHWESDNFAVKSMADKKPISIRGSLTPQSNDLPLEIRVTYSNDLGTADYRIAYEFDDSENHGFPHSIRTYFLGHGPDQLVSEISILSVKIEDSALDESHFNLFASRRVAPGSLLLHTNDSIYAKLPSGRLVETPAAVPPVEFTRKDLHRNRFYYCAAGLWTLSCLVLGSFSMRKRMSVQIPTKQIDEKT